MKDKLTFVISGDIIILDHDFYTKNENKQDIMIKARTLLVVHDDYVPEICINEAYCYVHGDPRFASGQVVELKWLYLIPLDLCHMHETKYNHLPEKEYPEE